MEVRSDYRRGNFSAATSFCGQVQVARTDGGERIEVARAIQPVKYVRSNGSHKLECPRRLEQRDKRVLAQEIDHVVHRLDPIKRGATAFRRPRGM
jgi:hypothetical protein